MEIGCQWCQTASVTAFMLGWNIPTTEWKGRMHSFLSKNEGSAAIFALRGVAANDRRPRSSTKKSEATTEKNKERNREPGPKALGGPSCFVALANGTIGTIRKSTRTMKKRKAMSDHVASLNRITDQSPPAIAELLKACCCENPALLSDVEKDALRQLLGIPVHPLFRADNFIQKRHHPAMHATLTEPKRGEWRTFDNDPFGTIHPKERVFNLDRSTKGMVNGWKWGDSSVWFSHSMSVILDHLSKNGWDGEKPVHFAIMKRDDPLVVQHKFNGAVSQSTRMFAICRGDRATPVVWCKCMNATCTLEPIFVVGNAFL